jgi:hypothetical protein
MRRVIDQSGHTTCSAEASDLPVNDPDEQQTNLFELQGQRLSDHHHDRRWHSRDSCLGGPGIAFEGSNATARPSAGKSIEREMTLLASSCTYYVQ